MENFRGLVLGRKEGRNTGGKEYRIRNTGLDWTGYQINLQKLKVPEEFSSKIVKRKGEENGYFLQV